MKNNRVFVLDNTKRPLMPCRPARARRLLKAGRAAVYRMRPFTIVLKERAGGAVQPVELKVDPGSKATGLALVAEFRRGREVVWAGELKHRREIVHDAMLRRRDLRGNRRCRKTRSRPERWNNRKRPKGWLAPSLRSLVGNVGTWGRRLAGFVPVAAVAVETVRFDTHAMTRPGIEGVEYQRGELAGFEVREYVFAKWGHKCAYCGAEGWPSKAGPGAPLEVEHVVPRSRGGTNRVSNLVAACIPCNRAKGNRPVEEFLADRPDVLKHVLAHAKAPLRDAAAVNATRYAVGTALKALGLPVSFWSGGRTKFNRTRQAYPKVHWIDAACVGESGAAVRLDPAMAPLRIEAKGRGVRQVVKMDDDGFPRTGPGRVKEVRGFRTGDLVRLTQTEGKYAGVHVGRMAGVRATGTLDIASPSGAKGRIGATWRKFALIQRSDGYAYA